MQIIKQFLIVGIIGQLVFSLMTCSDDEGPTESENQAPDAPTCKKVAAVNLRLKAALRVPRPGNKIYIPSWLLNVTEDLASDRVWPFL